MRALSPGLWVLILLACSSCFARLALAEQTPPPAPTTPPPSSFPELPGEEYQINLIDSAMKRGHLQADPHPEGKVIERILYAPYDVLTPGDPWPMFLKSFHARTKVQVIHRELLFQKGDHWDPALIQETERNLQNYLFLSMARIVPCRGSQPDRVIALVVTKDLWSLRVNTDFSFADSRLELLSIELVENNLGGWNRTLGATFSEDLAASTFGLEVGDPRLAGSRVGATASGSLIINRASGSREGDVETFTLGQPLFSLETHWAWNLSFNHRRDVYRLFSGGELAEVTDSATGQSLPYSYDRDLWNLTASVTRSMGESYKHDVSFGWKGYSWNFAPPVSPGTVSAATLANFESTIQPLDEEAGMLFVNYHFYKPSYVTLEDINTFALAENFQLGPSFSLEGRLARPQFGLNSSFFEAESDLSYRWWTNDDLLTLSSELAARYEDDELVHSTYGDGNWVNELAMVRLQNASPQFGIFRFHTQLQLIRRVRDLQRNVETLGGDTLLRGYPSAYFVGPNLWSTNFELRTRPTEFHTVYAGLVGFVDLGDAFTGLSDASVHASTGAGLRLVFPQFNRAALRLDVGIPLESAPDISPITVVAQFGQAFN